MGKEDLLMERSKHDPIVTGDHQRKEIVDRHLYPN
jgi:hypothetical protein